jgi:cytochrome P450
LGNVRELQADRLGFLLRNLHAYGEVAQLRIFGRRIYAVYHPDGVKHVLQDNHTNYVKGPVFDPIRAIAGNSLFTPKASCGCANGASCSRPFTANGLLPSAR